MGYFQKFIEVKEANLPAFEEITDPDKSPKEQASADGFTATRIFKVAWTYRIDFINRVLGYARGTTLYMPLRYPWNSAAIAMSASVEPQGQGSWNSAKLIMDYDVCFVTVEYRVPEFETRTAKLAGDDADLVSEPWVSESIDGAAEFVTVPADGLFWDYAQTEALKDNEAPGMLRKMMSWNYTMHRLPMIPSTIQALVGRVNKRKVISIGHKFTFMPETLLVGAPSFKPVLAASGMRSWDITISCTYNPTGWNKFIRKGGKQPQSIYGDVEEATSAGIQIKTGEFKPYIPTSFIPIFRETT